MKKRLQCEMPGLSIKELPLILVLLLILPHTGCTILGLAVGALLGGGALLRCGLRRLGLLGRLILLLDLLSLDFDRRDRSSPGQEAQDRGYRKKSSHRLSRGAAFALP